MHKAPPWDVLTGRRKKQRNDLPLHIKPAALGALNIDALYTLPQRDIMRAKLLHAMRWIKWSPMYDIILKDLQVTEMRNDRVTFPPQDIVQLWNVNKLTTPTGPVLAYCNGFPRVEEREEGDRRRPLFEPIINDIIARNSALATTTAYTRRDVIRRALYNTSAGAQFDFAAWFDQIKLADEIRCFFGVRTTDRCFTLPYIPMGFRPSCETAEAVTESIAHAPTNPDTVSVATCVDNILFLGDPTELKQVGQTFVTRCAQVGAVLKDPTVNIVTQYDFLGETYNHVAKTRALTTKTQMKCAYVHAIIGQKKLTTRQIMAIVGLLLFASNTLAIHLARFHFVLRYFPRQNVP